MPAAPPFDPNKPFETVQAPPFDPNKPFEAVPSAPPSSSGGMADSLAGEIGGQFTTGLKKVGAAFNPFSPENRAISEQERKASIFNPGPELERGKLLASGVGGALQAASSPITGAVRAIGAPAIQAADIPMEWLTKKIFGEDVKLPPRVTHEQAADVAESLMGGIAPRGGLKGVPSVPSSPFAKPQAASPAPSLEEIFDSSNAHYEALKDMAVPLSRRVVSDLSTSAKSELEKDAFYKEDQPRTFRALDRLVNKEGDSTSKEVYAVRTALGRVIKDAPGTSDAEAAGRAIEKIDEYLSNIPEFAETSQRARKDWAAAKTSQMVQDLEQRAQRAAGASGSGANLDNAMRQQIKSLLNDKKRVGRLTADEKEVAEQLVRGGTVGNLARVLSKLGPKHPLTGWGSAIAADFAGGGGAATGSLGLGAIAQWIAEKGTTGRIRQLDELIRSRSALAREGRGEPVISPRERVQNEARSALRDKEVSLSKEDRQLLRRAARGDAPAEEMLAAKKLLDRQSQDPLKRDVLQRARGGRPMYTRPLNIGSEGEIMEMSLDKSRPYRNVPDSLMGYRRHGQQRGFEDSNYPHTQNVEITLDNGDKFTDAIKGMNRRHAIERAYRNWVGAKNIRAIPEPSRIPIRGKFDEPGYGGPS